MSDSLNTSASTSATPENATNKVSHSAGRYRLPSILAVILLCCGVGAAAVWQWSSSRELANAERAGRLGNWKVARTCLNKYLNSHPTDAKAHMLMAEAIVKDRSDDPRVSALEAIDHLRQVRGDDATVGPARLQEARLSLLVLHQPASAEKLLADALKLTPQSFESSLLMWKVLDLTGRHIISREHFWRTYELSARDKRPEQLREWFLSEFYPETANQSFYQVLGATEIGKIPASVNLLVRFREREPEASFIHAALASWYLENGRPASSLELLKEAPSVTIAMQDPFYVTALFETLVSLGEFEKASSCFEHFPQPHSGYLYWRCEGQYRQQIKNDSESAADSYQAALTCWPAKFDWALMMRLSDCFRKASRLDEAKAIQARVTHLTTVVLTKENMLLLRDRLRNLNDIDVATDVRNLYQEFELTEEAAAWEEHRRSLQKFPTPFLPSEVETPSHPDYTSPPGDVAPKTVLPERNKQ